MKTCYVPKAFKAPALNVIADSNAIIDEYAAQGFDLTLRQLYYQHVARALLPNTQRSYKRLGGIINDARLAGLIDWDAIVDRTRNVQENDSWEAPSEILRDAARWFNLDPWIAQGYRPEVWIEKDALRGVISGVCSRHNVPHFSCRGYVSQSEMWAAAQRLGPAWTEEKEAIIFHLGDHDPSGIDMTRDIQDRLDIFTDTDDDLNSIRVVRIALNMDQVDAYGPPPNPAKTTDSRFEDYRARFGDESWELDALNPPVLVALIEEAIGSLIDREAWKKTVTQETIGRARLRNLAKEWENAE